MIKFLDNKIGLGQMLAKEKEKKAICVAVSISCYGVANAVKNLLR